jgi:hypothetical protein
MIQRGFDKATEQGVVLDGLAVATLTYPSI